MIPKIIHYCWLSEEIKPDGIQKCMQSWSDVMPDYQLMLWDAKRFPIDKHPFVKKAFECKKWAFATDYIRLYALYHYGGIYLDTDVIVYRKFDVFLYHSFFSSVEFHAPIFYEGIKRGDHTMGLGIQAAVLGSIPRHSWVGELLEFYDGIVFENSKKFMSTYIMPRVLAISAVKYGFKYEPSYQHLQGDIHLYPPDVFSTNNEVSEIKYSTHLCVNSWFEIKVNPYKKFILEKIIGINNWNRIKKSLERKK
jgi:hypothetical protein